MQCVVIKMNTFLVSDTRLAVILISSCACAIFGAAVRWCVLAWAGFFVAVVRFFIELVALLLLGLESL